MRRLQLGILGLSLGVFAADLTLSGCSSQTSTAPSGGGGGGGGTPTGKGSGAIGKGEMKAIEAKGSGTLKGKITLKGGDPTAALEELTKRLRAEIDKKPDDKSVCMAGNPAEVTEQTYRIGDNKQVGNVVVWVLPPDRNSFFKVDEKEVAEAKSHPVEIDQPHCAFLPHVAVAFAGYADPKNPRKIVPTDQKVIAVNNAKISHNTNIKGGPQNPGENKLLKPGEKIEATLQPERSPINITCNIHPWMNAYVWPLGTPYATVSRSDTAPKEQRVERKDDKFGTYEIKNLPTGHKVRVVAWHEKSGFLTGTDGEEIEIPAGGATKDFEVEIKP
jgi:hypothetical protein